MDNVVYVVIDMQKDFVTGSLGTKEAEAIVPYIKEKLENRNANDVILFTRDTHDEKYLSETEEGKKLPIKHCIKGTDGWNLVEDLQITGEWIDYYDKPTFGAVDMWKDLERSSELITDIANTFYIMGVCTDICVVSNALMIKALFPNMKIIVDAKGCAGTTPEMHNKALDVMESCHIDIVGRDE